MRIAGLIAGLVVMLTPLASAQTEVRGLAEARAAFERSDYTETYVRYSALEDTSAAAEARFHLSLIHEHGFGVVPTNDALALRLLRRSAEAEYPPALTNLGMRHYEGNGVPQDRAEGLRLWRRASELGEVGATYSIAMYYLYIHGAERNQAEGAVWMRRAADVGHADAQFELARLYERGQGVETNAGEAARLMRLAAIQGHRSARVAMVQYAFDGTGMARDLVRAEMWALIVERHDEPVAAAGRAALNRELSDAQRAEAARLADRCEAESSAC